MLLVMHSPTLWPTRVRRRKCRGRSNITTTVSSATKLQNRIA